MARTQTLTADEKRAAVGYGPVGDAGSDPAQGPFDDSTVKRVRGLTPSLKYRPDQARAPAGTSNGGQWVDEGGGFDGDDGRVISDALPDDFFPPGSRVAQGRAQRLQELVRRLFAAKPKVPDFLVRKPSKGKLTGKTDDLAAEERSFVDELIDLGNDVDLIPTGPGRTPDFKINGKLFERKRVSGVQRTDSDGISSAITNRILNARGQAADVIVDAREQLGMTKEIAERVFVRAFNADSRKGIQSITILTRDGPVYSIRSP